MERRVQFQFPTAKDPARVLFLNLSGIDAFDTERFKQSFHVRIHLGVTEVPKLDRERTAEMPQQIHVDPNARKVLEPTPGDDDATLLCIGHSTGHQVVNVLVN